MAITRFLKINGEVTLMLNIFCDKCKTSLEWSDNNMGSEEYIFVKPCENCTLVKNVRMPNVNKFLSYNLADLDWDVNAPSVRIINCLRVEDIYSVEQVAKKSKHWLLKIPNFGRKSLYFLESELKKIGIELHEGSYSDNENTFYNIKFIKE